MQSQTSLAEMVTCGEVKSVMLPYLNFEEMVCLGEKLVRDRDYAPTQGDTGYFLTNAKGADDDEHPSR